MEQPNYPDMHVEMPEAEDLRRTLIHQVFGALRKLDVSAARELVLGAANLERSANSATEKPTFSVMASDGPVLSFMVDCGALFRPEVHVDPKKLDRSIPEQEEVFQKCAAIVSFMQEALATEGDNHLVVIPFEFWKQQGEGDVENWQGLSEIWTAAK